MKAQDIREMTDSAVKEKIDELRKELFNLNLRKGAFDLDNTSQIRFLKKDIARLQTVLQENRLKKGAEGDSKETT